MKNKNLLPCIYDIYYMRPDVETCFKVSLLANVTMLYVFFLKIVQQSNYVIKLYQTIELQSMTSDTLTGCTPKVPSSAVDGRPTSSDVYCIHRHTT